MVAEALAGRGWIRDIQRGLSLPALLEYHCLWERLSSFSLTPSIPDSFHWKWSSDGNFSSSSTYKAFFLGTSLLWKTQAPNKCRLFMWLALLGRYWTSERLHRHGLHDDPTCALCAQEGESVDHLLLTCVHSRETWFRCLGRFNLQNLAPATEGVVDCRQEEGRESP
ncbi:hypothetical protein U9M48_027296 [Paspalum notatum var. saurae]|uniref:Reverse transcriptase zinc-binding domain-containing protein n=1 Tax=Paspalum notatum var. saurae TaxID=547442 RepID=A0AAQ3WZB6_PASNO